MATGTHSVGGAAIREAPATTRNRTLGNLYEFCPDSEEFSTYMERVEIYFAANDVPEDKKVPGGDTYGLLRSLVAPDSPMANTLTQLTTILHEHFKPIPSLIAERFQFHKRIQSSDESISAYITELQRLAAFSPPGRHAA